MTEKISRQEALDKGLPGYYTSAPCDMGHDAFRNVETGDCVKCTSEHESEARYKAAERQILSRGRAKVMRYRTFYTGIPCRRGHDSPRLTSNGDCLKCADVRSDLNGKSPLVVGEFITHRDDLDAVRAFVEALRLARTIG
jgi:hypothetical protein